MLCAHTIRRLEPGTFDQFVRTFGPPEDADPGNWVRFHLLRSVTDENEVITIGFFDGTLEEMERSLDELGYAARRRRSRRSCGRSWPTASMRSS